MRVTRPMASCFTYTLGTSLYIPLTSRSNSLTLPTTRGPNFTLSSDVVTALCRVRDAENQNERWASWCKQLDCIQDGQKMNLPDAEPSVASLDITQIVMPKEKTDNGEDDDDDGRSPSIKELSNEVKQMLMKPDNSFEAVVFAGEGEPTLRLLGLLGLAKRIRHYSDLPLRVTTNGLVYQENAAQRLQSSGISSVSVALMTHDPDQYDELMQPVVVTSDHSSSSSSSSSSNNLRPHDVVCRFIYHALEAGLTVEATGVKHEDVNAVATEEFAHSLGIKEKFRWRPYFK